MDAARAFAVLYEIEREVRRQQDAYGRETPTSVVVMPHDRADVVRLDDVRQALLFYRDRAVTPQ
jgi:hypothetical protein